LSRDPQDDVQLWNAFRNGDDNALVVIFEKESDALFNYGVRIFHNDEIVRDTIQDLFAELCQNRSGLSETTSIRFYLLKALRRKLFRAKKKSLRHMFWLTEPENIPSAEFQMISQQVAEEKRDKVTYLLKSLSKRQREAIFLRYYEDLSYEKIADILNIGRQGAYNMVSKAMLQLRECLLSK
ncbi:MAG TPA: sigma-70 family RNA polymerase sigma factor, partial [Cyclobacteriaceae bacterium]|nr:sigma-70 family RNA polymerase sigma factor [Cyclobacteriaceae bacterium]